MIVIPGVDVRGGRVVRLLRGDPGAETAYHEDPPTVASAWADQGAEWVHVVDLDAALEAGDNRELIRETVRRAPVPVQVGGGLRDVEGVAEVMDAGASRVVLGTAALGSEGFLRGAVDRWGDAVVVALDTDGTDVLIRGWTERAEPLLEALPRLATAGAPRFLVTSVSRDGAMGGPDLDLYAKVAGRAGRPVIASGGVRDASDLKALAGTGVEAVVVGRALYEGTLTLADAVEAAG